MKNKILIIDDDNRNIFALKAILKARGFDCLTALSAREGLRLLGPDTQIGVVLMDMMMPEMDGYEAILQIRHNLHTRNLPIISVTAQAMAGDREKCMEAGADAYISKPIDIDVLVQYLHNYLKN